MKKYFLRSTPEEQGMDSMNIRRFMEALDQLGYRIHSFLLLRHQKVVAEAAKYPVMPEDKRLVYSLSKTFTGTAVGIAVREGLLTPDDSVISYFKDYDTENLDERARKLTIKNLLTMSTGHGGDAIGPMCNGDADWVKTFFNCEFTYEPGERFVYDSGATYMLSEIITRITHMSLFEYLQPRLFEPLHITDVLWENHGDVTTGAWGLLIAPEDIAKLGVLYLNNGTFEGREILRSDWVRDAVCQQIPTDRVSADGWSRGYGYQIWKNNADSYRADGAFGQFCMVFPKEGIIIVTTAEELTPERMFPLIEKYLLKNLTDHPFCPNAPLYGQLQKYIRTWELPAQFPPTVSYMEICLPVREYFVAGINNDTYILHFEISNSHMELRINDIQTIKSSNITYESGETPYVIMPPTVSPIIGNIQRSRKWSYAAHHQWINDGTLLLTICYRETGHRQEWLFVFTDDRVEITISNSCKRFFGLSPMKSDKNMDFGDMQLKGAVLHS